MINKRRKSGVFHKFGRVFTPDALPVATPFSHLLRHAEDTVAQFLPPVPQGDNVWDGDSGDDGQAGGEVGGGRIEDGQVGAGGDKRRSDQK